MEKDSKKLVKGFTFGKFMPFHKGHEAMIRFAQTKCDHLSILICCSDKEVIPSQQRMHWLKETFAYDDSIEVLVFNYMESDFPNTSVSSKEVSAIWSNYFQERFPDYDLVVTSEPYGEFVAQYMNIQHILFDQERTIVPISASAIRSDLSANWHQLPFSVQKDLVTKIVILGTECSGKTTLVNAISQYCDIAISPEAGRELIQNSNNFDLSLLYRVADKHAKNIQEATTKSPINIIDTDIHITQSYASRYFNTYLDLAPEIYEINKADLYIYLKNEIPYQQDGTRLNEVERNQMDLSHRKTLKKFGIDFIEISGSLDERLNKTINQINELLKQKGHKALKPRSGLL